MKREELVFVPEWKGAIEGWCVTFIQKNLWRVLPEHDFDDLYQDAYFYFLECCRRYGTVTEAAHFMALMKRCLWIHVTDLANKRTQRAEVSFTRVVAESRVDLMEVADPRPSTLLSSDLEMQISEAPPEVQQLIRAALESEKGKKFRRRRGSRETTNQYLCRLAGLDSKTLRAKFEDWLAGVHEKSQEVAAII